MTSSIVYSPRGRKPVSSKWGKYNTIEEWYNDEFCHDESFSGCGEFLRDCYSLEQLVCRSKEVYKNFKNTENESLGDFIKNAIDTSSNTRQEWVEKEIKTMIENSYKDEVVVVTKEPYMQMCALFGFLLTSDGFVPVRITEEQLRDGWYAMYLYRSIFKRGSAYQYFRLLKWKDDNDVKGSSPSKKRQRSQKPDYDSIMRHFDDVISKKKQKHEQSQDEKLREEVEKLKSELSVIRKTMVKLSEAVQ